MSPGSPYRQPTASRMDPRPPSTQRSGTGVRSGVAPNPPYRSTPDDREAYSSVLEELNGILELFRPLPEGGFWGGALARELCCGDRVVVNFRVRRGEHGEQQTRDGLTALRAVREWEIPSVILPRRFGYTGAVLWFTEPAHPGLLLSQMLADGAGPA